MQTHHTTYAAGPAHLVARIAASYTCGHCNSDTEAWIDHDGNPHVNIHHDDGCPVLEGTLSAAPDVARAAQPPTS
ncbi:hypothetical protein ACIGQE_15375 [Streptomyces sp. NPDC053429]|uniref:hypothetical protein n=1 Tax=Streptomyces sp. NPDC053429 TaxID=3365702 RepID=UPI0037D02B90